MRIVIVGGGEIGFALTQTLVSEHEVFVVDNVREISRRFEPIDIQFVLGAWPAKDLTVAVLCACQ